MQAPIYQYRIILPFDDQVINVATDMDFNLDGEIRSPITDKISAKSSFVVRHKPRSMRRLTMERLFRLHHARLFCADR
jgi:hypothetical protein